MIRILALCGSLRRESLNRRALVAASALAPADCEIALSSRLAELPLFSPDLDQPGLPLPPAVSAFFSEVDSADGLMIACPEYAHGVPGAFKNALDWLVGSVSFPGKPVALLNIAPRAHHAQSQLREILITMSAAIIDEAGCTTAFPKPDEPQVAAEFEARLSASLAAFAQRLRRPEVQ
jgi:chromate reductase, NAD(P)H dehydrogenase (quinone)